MKSIIYINKNDKEKVTKVKSIAFFNNIKIENAGIEDINSLPEDAEMLIMRGFDRSGMNSFLSDLKKKGIKIELKCVETETNSSWTLDKLYWEIKKENEVMRSMRTDWI